jgi:thioredoxin reductase (NADPH)
MRPDGRLLGCKASAIPITAVNTTLLALVVYALPMLIVLAVYGRRRRRRHADASMRLQTAAETGLVEPPSLHPVINASQCIGSGVCVSACPEKALGIIDGKAVLAEPSKCIGHGACMASCPVDAISLVYGTERRGIDIPEVNPQFESNVRGIFVAGELGGMGLIRKAAEQGKQAIKTIASRPRNASQYDVLIVGAGPAGISAGLAAIEQGLTYRLIEQEAGLGGSVFHYPRNKVAMTAPVDLPLVGKMKFVEVTKERLLAFWQDIVVRTRLKISSSERLEAVERQDGVFQVRTTKGKYQVSNVLLAIGRRGSPRKLEVPGEDQAKVTYRLADAEQYSSRDVMVVGGGDSAIEAALALTEAGARTTLCYRGAAFNRIKPANRQRLEAAARDKRLSVLLGTEIRSIESDSVQIVRGDRESTLRNDAVIVCVGGVLPTELLKSMGINFDTKYGTA